MTLIQNPLGDSVGQMASVPFALGFALAPIAAFAGGGAWEIA